MSGFRSACLRSQPRRCRGAQAGTALVELLVATAVLALFLILTDYVFLSVYRASQVTHGAADLQQNARAAVMRLRRELRESQASAVVCYPDPLCVGPSAQIMFPSARPSDAASTFCLDVAVEDPWRRALESACSSPIPLSGTYGPVWQRYLAYHRSGDELRRVVQARPIALPVASTSGQVVAAYVRAFEVTRSGRLVRISLALRSQSPGGAAGSTPQQMRLDDTVVLRN